MDSLILQHAVAEKNLSILLECHLMGYQMEVMVQGATLNLGKPTQEIVTTWAPLLMLKWCVYFVLASN